MKTGRKIVLATSIAETSLTIPDIRVVVDGGQARRARFDPGSGMSRLVTERVTRAEPTQRAGRAGRVAEGTCYHAWTRGEQGALAAYPPAEIEAADLAGLALELAQWGSAEDTMDFLTPPPDGALSEARGLLRMLGALDQDNRITPHGRVLAGLPLHPRLAHMLTQGGTDAARLAALLAERDPLRGAPVDLSLRLEAIKDVKTFRSRRPYEVNRAVLDRIRSEETRLRRRTEPAPRLAPAALAALAYPDRIGQRRKGEAPRYVLSGGKGAVLRSGDTLAGAGFIVALDTDGNPREATVRLAAEITLSEIRDLFGDQIAWVDDCAWSRRERRVVARRQERFGVTQHPTAAGEPIKITLLSPAQRPVQVTRDLPGFWAGSYVDVRKDMRARYPRHPWPEDPTQADPTLKAKRKR